MEATITEDGGPTEADYIEYAEAEADEATHRDDPHSSGCAVWVGEKCDCVMGRIEL